MLYQNYFYELCQERLINKQKISILVTKEFLNCSRFRLFLNLLVNKHQCKVRGQPLRGE